MENIEKARAFLNKYIKFNDTTRLGENFSERIEILDEKYGNANSLHLKKRDRAKLLKGARIIRDEYLKDYNRMVNQNADMLEEMKQEIGTFSQELLVVIYKTAINKDIRKLVLLQIQKNNELIRLLNRDYLSSGYIYLLLDKLTKEEVMRLRHLREGMSSLEVEGEVIEKISPVVIDLLIRAYRGEFANVKEKYFKEIGIHSENEFIQYVENNLRLIAEEQENNKKH